MRIIPLTLNKKLVAVTMVDDCLFSLLSEQEWHLSSKGYATRSETIDGREFRIQMHQIVAEWVRGSDLEVDHVDRNKLNNQKINLRLVSTSINQHNRGLQSNNKSGIKGVHWDSDRGLWRAQIYKDRKQYRVGRFATIEEAEQALLNFRQNHGPELDSTW